MKKTTISDILDNLFWYIIYTLPIILYLFYICAINSDISVIDFFNLYFSFASDNIIFSSLVSLFGSEGVLSLFSSDSFIFYFCSYFVSAFLLHLAVDVLLFVPRFCHKVMGDFFCKGGKLSK